MKTLISLLEACQQYYFDVDKVKLLLDAGADINTVGQHNLASLETAIYNHRVTLSWKEFNLLSFDISVFERNNLRNL